jgi:uncharacterized protein (DUF2267 family)
MSSQTVSLKKQAVISLLRYSYYQEKNDPALDVILARWPGGYLFKNYIATQTRYIAFKEKMGSLAAKIVKPKLESQAFDNIDLVCLGVAKDILKQRIVLNIIDKIESQVTNVWSRIDNNLNSGEAPAAFWFNYLQEAASYYISGSLESIRNMDNNSDDKQAIVRTVQYGIKKQLPIEYVQEFGMDIDELIRQYFCDPDYNYREFKTEFAERIRAKLKPKLAKAVEPVVRLAIPHIAEVGGTIVEENTKSLSDWAWSQTVSFASSTSIMAAFFGAVCYFYDPSFTVGAFSLFLTAFLANVGIFCFEFLHSQQVAIQHSAVKNSLKENYSKDFKRAVAGSLADFHNQYLGIYDPKTPDDFMDGITEGLIDGILSQVAKKVIKLMKL